MPHETLPVIPPATPSPPERGSTRITAILLVCGAFLCFSMLDATAKWLSPRIGTVETTWVRYFVAFVFVALVINPWRIPNLLHTRRPGLQALRSLMLFASTLLNFLALQYLQLAETISIMFLQPLLVALLAGPILGEWAGPRRLIAIGVGFIGVLLVTRPGLGGIHWAAIYSFAGVLIYAGFALVTRFLARDDSPETTMFYSTVAGVIILTPAMPFIWQVSLTGPILLAMAIIGVCASVGHWMLILANRIAPAPVLAPFLYTQILWMTGLGYFVFGDVPDRWTLAGALIVVCSGLYLLHRERVKAQEKQ